MVLTEKDGRRFFKLFNALIQFANKDLNCNLQVWDPQTGEGNIDNLGRVSAELWSDPAPVIERFVEQNPAGLTRRELNEVLLWKHALSGIYQFVLDEWGRSVMFDGAWAYEVCGIMQELGGMLPCIPAMVHATLLPFADAVVNAVVCEDVPLEISPEMRVAIWKGVTSAREQRRYVSTANALVKAYPAIMEERENARIEQAIQQAEDEMNADANPPGMHRGVLAGLEDDEREAAFLAGIAEASKIVGFTPADVIRQCCTPGSPSTNLRELLLRERKDDLYVLAQDWGG